MGTTYKGNSPSYHSLVDNINSTFKAYKYENGYFGIKGKSKQESNRQINCSDHVAEAEAFYNKIAYGGIETTHDNDNRKQTKLKDGTIITFREITSTVGSPAVEINIKKSTNTGGVKKQKIHFEKE